MNRREFLASLTVSPAALTGARMVGPDFIKHARLSRAFLQNAVDREDGKWLPYHRLTFKEKPGYLRHAAWDYSENLGRWLYGSIYARRVLGETSGLEFEETFRRAIFKGLGPDGLHYYPASRPCERSRVNSVAVFWDNRSVFMGLTELWALTHDNELRRQLDKMVDTLEGYAVIGPGPGQAYFAVDDIPPGYRPAPRAEPYLSLNTGGFVLPLLHYFRLSGSERALRLALALAEFGVNHHNPRKHPTPAGPVLGIWNVHGALFSVAGIAAAIPYQKDKDQHLAWARRLYEFTRDHLASSYGWVAELETHQPKLVAAGKKVDTEGCAIVDMTQLAIRLAHQGYPDAWNLAERFARNYMDAGQLADTGPLEREVPRTYDACADNHGMPERGRGAFVGHGAPADFFCLEGRRGADVQNCCGSHYPFGNHFIWENIVTKDAGGVHVNLLFSRDTPWCRVVSELPGRGLVTVTMREGSDLLVRVPDWANKRQVEVRVGKRRVEPSWKDGFVRFRGLKEAATVQVSYPLRREKRKESFMGHEVEVEWLGDTVAGVSPGGTVLPLFNR